MKQESKTLIDRYPKKTLSWLEYEKFLKTSRLFSSKHSVKIKTIEKESLYPKIRFTWK